MLPQKSSLDAAVEIAVVGRENAAAWEAVRNERSQLGMVYVQRGEDHPTMGDSTARWFLTARIPHIPYLIGYASLLQQEKRAYVAIVVHPDYTRKGIGTTLLSATYTFAQNEKSIDEFTAVVVPASPGQCLLLSRSYPQGMVYRHLPVSPVNASARNQYIMNVKD
ncbi:GNAT family N-acetyltransferase [Candidatus Woesearchaeota archaeon]|nr:GNAT family N-acetyltransferase [Candidatus Woesearchaeota archaeon]